jgi:hypothetical protein
VFGAATARSVTKGGTSVGVLVLFALRSDYRGNAAVESMLVRKVVDGMTSSGVTPTTRTLSGQRVAIASTAKDGTVVVWYSRPVLGVVAGGADPALVTEYARAYLAAR